MRIGIIGLGIVGKANRQGFQEAGHDIEIHDTRFGTKITNVIDTDIAFICVPTPQKEDNSCDTSIVESVLEELNNIYYKGIVAIKSSVIPMFTNRMSLIYKRLTIAFVPEFLRERCANTDFINNHELLAVGTYSKKVYNKIVKAHMPYPKNTVMLTPVEAELLKYYNNVFAALKIVFANNFYEICNKLDSNYSVIKDAYIKTGKAKDMYLDVNEDLRGYAGMCLPKDTNAIISLMKELGIDLDLIKSIDSDNQKFKKTVIGDMRK